MFRLPRVLIIHIAGFCDESVNERLYNIFKFRELYFINRLIQNINLGEDELIKPAEYKYVRELDCAEQDSFDKKQLIEVLPKTTNLELFSVAELDTEIFDVLRKCLYFKYLCIMPGLHYYKKMILPKFEDEEGDETLVGEITPQTLTVSGLDVETIELSQYFDGDETIVLKGLGKLKTLKLEGSEFSLTIEDCPNIRSLYLVDYYQGIYMETIRDLHIEFSDQCKRHRWDILVVGANLENLTILFHSEVKSVAEIDLSPARNFRQLMILDKAEVRKPKHLTKFVIKSAPPQMYVCIGYVLKRVTFEPGSLRGCRITGIKIKNPTTGNVWRKVRTKTPKKFLRGKQKNSIKFY